MQLAARSVILGAAGSLLAVWLTAAFFTAAAPTTGDPLVILQSPVAGATNSPFASLSARQVKSLDRQLDASSSLKPGVYQTRPYDIILVVPERGHDDHCVVSASDAGSKMRVIKPELRAVPIAPSK